MKKLMKAAMIATAFFAVNAVAAPCVQVVTGAYNHTIRGYNGDPEIVKSLDALNLYMATCKQAKEMKGKGVTHDEWVNNVKKVGQKYALQGKIHPDVYYTNVVIADIAYE